MPHNARPQTAAEGCAFFLVWFCLVMVLCIVTVLIDRGCLHG